MKVNSKDATTCSQCGFVFKTEDGMGRCRNCGMIQVTGFDGLSLFRFEEEVGQETVNPDLKLLGIKEKFDFNSLPQKPLPPGAIRDSSPSADRNGLNDYGDDWEEYVAASAKGAIEQWAYCPRCAEKFKTYRREILSATSCPKCDRIIRVYVKNPEVLAKGEKYINLDN